MAVFSGNGAIGSPSFTFSSDTNTGIYRPDSDQLALVTGGVNAIFVDAGQNVGIACTPSTVFDIAVNDPTIYSPTNVLTRTGPNVRITNLDTTSLGSYAGVSFEAYGDSGNRTGAGIGLIKVESSGSNGAMVFGIRDNSFGNVQEGMRLTSDYRLGVGTTTPGATFEVDSTSTPFIVRQGGIEALRVDSSGNVDVADKLLAKQTSLDDTTRHLYHQGINVAKGTPDTAFTVICSGGGSGSSHRASISFRLLITVNANTTTGGTGYATYAVNGLIRRGAGGTTPSMFLGTPEIIDSYSSFSAITITPSLQDASGTGADFAIQWDTGSVISQSRVFTSLEFVRATANNSNMDILPL